MTRHAPTRGSHRHGRGAAKPGPAPVPAPSGVSGSTARDVRAVAERFVVTELIEHIFSISAGMVGVCLTGIGLVRVVIATRQLESLADDLLVVDAFAFLIACLLAYAALRTLSEARSRLFARLADVTFLGGLSFMFVVCCVLAYSMK